MGVLGNFSFLLTDFWPRRFCSYSDVRYEIFFYWFLIFTRNFFFRPTFSPALQVATFLRIIKQFRWISRKKWKNEWMSEWNEVITQHSILFESFETLHSRSSTRTFHNSKHNIELDVRIDEWLGFNGVEKDFDRGFVRILLNSVLNTFGPN